MKVTRGHPSHNATHAFHSPFHMSGLLVVIRATSSTATTFCSRLAAANVPMLTIKELAGHVSLETTMRYMHLSPAAPREGIKALEAGAEALASAPGNPNDDAQ
jgi:integrase